MKRPEQAPRVSERYLLQYPGGVERIAEVVPAGEGTAFRPLPFEDALPLAPVPGGVWQLEPGERIVRDWTGAYWSITAAGTEPHPLAAGELPVTCVIEFRRHTPPGTPLSYRTGSIEWPERLSDERLVAMLRRAWEQMETDGEERRRRSNGKHAVLSELL